MGCDTGQMGGAEGSTGKSSDLRNPLLGQERRYRIGGVVAVATGAVLLAVSGFTVWLDVLGLRLTGYRLAELIGDFGDELSAVPPPWVGAGWYLFPVSAGVCWLLAFRRSPPAASLAHVVLGSAAALAAGLYLGFADFQPGPVLALIGGLLILMGGLSAVSGKAGR